MMIKTQPNGTRRYRGLSLDMFDYILCQMPKSLNIRLRLIYSVAPLLVFYLGTWPFAHQFDSEDPSCNLLPTLL